MNANSGAPSYTGPRTVAEAFGQIVWLLSQSPVHRHLKLADLERTVMPAVTHEQFRIFSFGPLPNVDADRPQATPLGANREGLEKMPVGVALWANLSEAAEGRVERNETLSVADWKSGDRLWLLELIVPFATPENRLAEIALADLVNGPFRGRVFNLHRTDPATGERTKITIDPSVIPSEHSVAPAS